jgi:hypothetical protein
MKQNIPDIRSIYLNSRPPHFCFIEEISVENLDKRIALQIVREVLAADLSCESKYFEEEGTFVFEARKLEGRRAFPFRTQSLGIVTMGIGTVINCDLPRIKWIKENLCPLGRDRLFSASTIASIEHFLSQDGQYLAGPDLKYACSTDTFRPSPLPEQIDLQLIKKEDIPGLYAHEEFRNALCYALDSARPDVLAVIARQEKKSSASPGQAQIVLKYGRSVWTYFLNIADMESARRW